MNGRIFIGIIADTANPEAVERLLNDIDELLLLDPELGTADVVLLENPSADERGCMRARTSGKLHVRMIHRRTQDEDHKRGLFGNVPLTSGRLPISTARTRLQRYLAQHTQDDCGYAWILDEDLRLSPILEGIRAGKPTVSQHLQRLLNEGVDVAIGPILGAPPLPARSSVRVNVEDVVRHIRVCEQLGPHATWPDRSEENAEHRAQYPEYYYDFTFTQQDAGQIPFWIEPLFVGEKVVSVFERMVDAFPGLMDGIPITRDIPLRSLQLQPSIGLARGGNTFVLAPRLLGRVPNLVPHFEGRACRRSDMVWARLAAQIEGARFARVPLAAWQDRTGAGRSSFDSDKLLDDVRGSALIRSMDVLIKEGLLVSGTKLSVKDAARGRELFASYFSQRMEAVRRSEQRVLALLDELQAFAHAPGDASFLAGKTRLLESIATFREALQPLMEPISTEEDARVTERFFLELYLNVAAYRIGCVGDVGAH